MEYVDINFGFTLYVDCPKCDSTIDVTTQDDDNLFSKAIFNNNWDDVYGLVVECHMCKHKFKAKSVIY